MKLFLVTCLLATSLLCVKAASATDGAEDKPEITKLELIDLGEGESDVDAKDTDVQRKRDSGYSYKRPDSFASVSRARLQVGQSGHSNNRGRIVNRNPVQINRPITKYGPPAGYQTSSPSTPNFHGQQHRDKLQQHHGHYNQQHSSNFNGRPSGLREQEVPSPVRQVDFVDPNPISSQNNQPFGIHSANYLPPQNQKLPEYSAPHAFSQPQTHQSLRPGDQPRPASLQSQDLVQPQGQISDAALFLAQNAQAIRQLYGAPPNEQDFAPNVEHRFPGQNDQFPDQQHGGQFDNFETGTQTPQGFPGPLPSYASGTLSARETLEQIQSLEKDRLIVQLQRALATQNLDAAGRYAENQPSFVQSQDLLASLGQRMKIHGLNARPSSVDLGAAGNTPFNQSPFLPGTTVGPGFPLSYGLTTTVQPPTSTATTTSTTTTTVQPPQAAKGDGTTQVGSSVPAPPFSPPSTGVPVYGGFVPTLITGPSFVSNVPSYGPGFLAPGAAIAPVQPSGSAPTHFGLPIPTDSNRKPVSGTTPSTTSPSTPTTPSTSRPGGPSSPPVNALPLPVHPLVTPLHPVAALQPVLPATSTTHVHPVQAPSATHPTYGLQASVINSLLYKPIKPVYPFYYYPNVAYQLQKPALPAYPWNYAPTYGQTKPTQTWK